jgi:two-component system, NtrC family, nitrogen regulation sensor histidine kinase NtrY
MDATMPQASHSNRPRWRRRLDLLFIRLDRYAPQITAAVIVFAFGMAAATYFVLASSSSTKPLAPATMASLLIANLLPAMALLVLLGRRIAQGRAEASPIGGRGTLHARLVALFSLIAAVPMLLMVIFASLLFQYGVEVWYTDRARGMFENAVTLTQQLYSERQQRVTAETEAMAKDVSSALAEVPLESRAFIDQFLFQVYRRELSEGAILAITPQNVVQTLAVINPYERPTENWVPAEIARKLRTERKTIFRDSGSRMEALTPLPGRPDLFLYGSRVADNASIAKASRAMSVMRDYNALISQSRKLQLRFNIALYVVTLLIVGAAVAIALNVADRLVRPVGELVDAARKVAGGDLSVRVPGRKSRDEVGILANTFNRMTGRLSQQNQQLVHTNELLERRRALTEAVMAGVSAGVIAVDANGMVRLINESATLLLGTDRDTVTGLSLHDVVPELGQLLKSGERDGTVQATFSGTSRTLAVRLVKDEVGHVLTFDDITQQLLDQRRAAWSDVARRVAHEIKNPLTPIQLAAERLKRRFSKEIQSDPATFERLTETIGRQVGDLRRMVDEFSSFARMPKPVFAPESVVDIIREGVFLHEVANPGIRFEFKAPNPQPKLVCDRRQLSQAISNIIKNGVEAIQAKFEDGTDVTGKISISLATLDENLIISVSDTGIGLPTERDRIVEPYMTTRAGGTGLGLAIVKKIVEEHFGEIAFSDRKGGGAVVSVAFDQVKLANLLIGRDIDQRPERDIPAELTRKERVDHGT